MKIEIANLIIEKAKTKDDGVYSFKGFKYAVKDNHFVLFADYFGIIHQRAGNFNAVIGKIEERYNIVKELKRLLKVL